MAGAGQSALCKGGLFVQRQATSGKTSISQAIATARSTYRQKKTPLLPRFDHRSMKQGLPYEVKMQNRLKDNTLYDACQGQGGIILENTESFLSASHIWGLPCLGHAQNIVSKALSSVPVLSASMCLTTASGDVSLSKGYSEYFLCGG